MEIRKVSPSWMSYGELNKIMYEKNLAVLEHSKCTVQTAGFITIIDVIFGA
jgi:hypothetical protein